MGNVRVEIRGDNGSTVWSAYTDAAGNFDFSQVSSGMYSVVATSGTQQAQQRINVNGIEANVTLRLPVRSSAHDGNGATSVSVAQYKVPEKARSAFYKAQEASIHGKIDEAQRQLEKALDIYPEYADALTLRAILKMADNDVSGAMTDLQQAVTDDQNCALAYIVLGAADNTQAKFDDAIRALGRGQTLAPNSWQAYLEMGKAMLGKGQYEPALRQFERAQSLLSKDYPLLHLTKAQAMIGLKSYSDAATELHAFLTAEPEGPRSQAAQRLLTQTEAAAANAGR